MIINIENVGGRKLGGCSEGVFSIYRRWVILERACCVEFVRYALIVYYCIYAITFVFALCM